MAAFDALNAAASRGFGTPVAISAALMIGAGFSPLHAAGLERETGGVFDVVVNGDLLAVTLYRKGALAVAAALTGLNDACPVPTRDGQREPSPATVPHSEV